MKLPPYLLCLALACCNTPTVTKHSDTVYTISDPGGMQATVKIFDAVPNNSGRPHRFAVVTASTGVAICEVTPNSLKPEKE